MSRIGLPGFDRIASLPSEAIEALRLIPQIVEHTRVLPGLREDMARVAVATDVLATMDGRMATIEEAMPVLVEVQRHLARLPETIERLNQDIEQLSGGVEKMLAALETLNSSIDSLQGSVEPMGRLAKRVPGQRRDQS